MTPMERLRRWAERGYISQDDVNELARLVERAEALEALVKSRPERDWIVELSSTKPLVGAERDDVGWWVSMGPVEEPDEYIAFGKTIPEAVAALAALRQSEGET